MVVLLIHAAFNMLKSWPSNKLLANFEDGQVDIGEGSSFMLWNVARAKYFGQIYSVNVNSFDA